MGRQRCASVLLGCDAARVLYLEVVHHPKCKALALMELEFVCVCQCTEHVHAVDSPLSDTADVDSVLVLVEDKLTQLNLASMTNDG